MHISEDFDRNKGEHGFDRTDLCFLYYTENSHEYKSSKDLSIIIFHHSYPNLLITNRKRRSLTPYSKLRRAYTVNIALQADSGQWQFTSAKISAVHQTHVKQRGSRGKPEVAIVSLAQGGNGVQRQRQNESN